MNSSTLQSPTGDLALCWLRNDLRSADNPALNHALQHHAQVLCLYIHEGDDNPADLPASAWWRQQAILDLANQLAGRLLYRCGDAQQILYQVIQTYAVKAVYWNRVYDPVGIQRDTQIKAWLQAQCMPVQSFPGNILFEPWRILKPDNTPYRVFTPFYKACLAHGLPSAAPLPTIDAKSLLPVDFDRQAVLAQAPQKSWVKQLAGHWQATRQAGLKQLGLFVEQGLSGYARKRDFPAQSGVSRLAPYLHFGQISAREIVAACQINIASEAYLRQLVWCDFAHYILYHWPATLKQPMDARFANFAWRDDGQALHAWRSGQTGIPIVDAAMRELWQTGYMHNRARMLVASLLCKHLLIDWRKGADWFMYTLLDADLANNTMGWQWVAGCGVDAAPYFRIFNPMTQGQRFDADGAYVRRWVPELGALPDRYIHSPWTAPGDLLASVGIRLGVDYPGPIIDLAEGRKRALAAWEDIRKHD